MRKASKALKRLLFMKIYNFAVEVYDSPGSRIGCWRSCGQQEWELISHEVILQPLFSSAHSLNSSNTSFSWLFVYTLRVRAVVVGCCARVILPKTKKWATAWRVAFACVRHVNDCYMFVENERSSHSWMVGLLSSNHLNKVGEFGERTERRRAELR